jgi:hypothetical protein
MKWRREIDYHGSRSYGADRSEVGAWSAVIAWFANISGRKTRARQTPSRGLPPATGRGFSLLGATSATPKHDSVDCPFRLKSGASAHGHDWRVLP